MKILFIIKPDVYDQFAKISQHLLQRNIQIIAIKTLHVSVEQARSLYALHQNKPYFPGLVQYTACGTSVILALELAQYHDIRAIKTELRREYCQMSAPLEGHLLSQSLTMGGFFALKEKASERYLGIHASDPERGDLEVELFFTPEELAFVPDPINQRADMILEESFSPSKS